MGSEIPRDFCEPMAGQLQAHGFKNSWEFLNPCKVNVPNKLKTSFWITWLVLLINIVCKSVIYVHCFQMTNMARNGNNVSISQEIFISRYFKLSHSKEHVILD